MKRNAIQLAHKTLIISLPAKWVRQHGLQKGDELDVEQSGDKLLISTEKSSALKKIALDVSGTGDMYHRILASAGKAGYTEIEVSFRSYEELKDLQEFIRNIMSNFNIVHQTKNSITLKVLYKDNFEQYDAALRRYFLLINHLVSEMFQAFLHNDFDWLKRTLLIKIDLNRLADYCRRSINLGFESQFKRLAPLYTIVEDLLNVVAVYRDIAEYILEQRLKSNEVTKVFFKELVAYQEQFYTLFYNFSIKGAADFGNKRKVLQKQFDALSEGASKKEIKLISLFETALFLLFELSGTVITLNL